MHINVRDFPWQSWYSLSTVSVQLCSPFLQDSNDYFSHGSTATWISCLQWSLLSLSWLFPMRHRHCWASPLLLESMLSILFHHTTQSLKEIFISSAYPLKVGQPQGSILMFCTKCSWFHVPKSTISTYSKYNRAHPLLLGLFTFNQFSLPFNISHQSS